MPDLSAFCMELLEGFVFVCFRRSAEVVVRELEHSARPAEMLAYPFSHMTTLDALLSHFYASSHDETVGIIAYLDPHPEWREVEVDCVLFSKSLQRTAAATEAHYLMLYNAMQVSDPP
ncbi:uncharacterized protein MYCFIDRAFT_194067 [Pseudocercospora fijiensis CIRAD86]|uniref:Uncharacterized protein n=1 Tax=Pseudocercospora fijiensis (strain CIRAD86) TaxID=383855 RepID=M3B948_PSEFD|nr:uncharacterized protein MYCFIDRAFT_194067 [Pseudocercospora fijiensis CIRAD86]EME85857.1 hypothetical protein MYCFIDRAFT_194067 [Pseudocercospora fijiensis CIRAD86]